MNDEEGDDELLAERVRENQRQVVRDMLESSRRFSYMESGSILFQALYADDERMVDLLLEHGAAVTGRDEGLPILHAALPDRHSVRIAESLLRHGFDVNTRDEYGRTALFFAYVSHTFEACAAIPVLERYGAQYDVSVAIAKFDLEFLRSAITADPDAIRNDPTDPEWLISALINTPICSQATVTDQAKVDCLEFLVGHGLVIPAPAVDRWIGRYELNRVRNNHLYDWFRAYRSRTAH